MTLWCKKHNHYKRSCPWCEVEEVEAENERLRAALKKVPEFFDMEEVEDPFSAIDMHITEVLSSPIKVDASKETEATWEPIHSSFFQDLRCLVSDGRNIAMGGYMDGLWYADERGNVDSVDITHFMLVNPPGITEGSNGICEECRKPYKHDLYIAWCNECGEKIERRVAEGGGNGGA